MDPWELFVVTLMGSVCLWRTVKALRTGIFSWEERGGTDHYASRRETQPRRFWLGIIFYGLIAIGCAAIVGISAYRRHMGLG